MIPVTLANSFAVLLGTIYPAYASYKALKTKTVTNQSKWMMYWVTFAICSCFESIADVFLAFWFPLYHELKLMFRLWMILPLSQRSQGSGIIYHRFINRFLTAKEKDIDRAIASIQNQSYNGLVQLSTGSFQWFKNWIIQLAIKMSAHAVEFVQEPNAEVIGRIRDRGIAPAELFATIEQSLGELLSPIGNEKDDNRFEEIDIDDAESEDPQVAKYASEAKKHEHKAANQAIEGKNNLKTSKSKVDGKLRKQPRRKAATTKLVALENFSSDDMDTDPNFQPVNSQG